ncbi:hypothetical protein [Niabella soli]|uniref:hypothetical protein n=1 Tax=Niabella soli TaxID=446683 RepID=UPI00024997A7|nr:hypothetical protein [Niabella soli]
MKRILSILLLVFLAAIPSMLFLASHQVNEQNRTIVLKRNHVKERLSPGIILSSNLMSE